MKSQVEILIEMLDEMLGIAKRRLERLPVPKRIIVKVEGKDNPDEPGKLDTYGYPKWRVLCTTCAASEGTSMS